MFLNPNLRNKAIEMKKYNDLINNSFITQKLLFMMIDYIYKIQMKLHL